MISFQVRIGSSSLRSNRNSRSRWSSFSSLVVSMDENAKAFLSMMKNRPGSVVRDEEDLKTYNMDWSKKWKGDSSIVLKPQSTNEVSSILKYCNQHKISVIPQSGNTSLVGGSVPRSGQLDHNSVILSLLNLKQIHSISAHGVLDCDAGCVLQDLQTHAAQYGLMIPVDLGAKGSCCIGGNVATNAGGQYYYRYGGLHSNVLGLQVVLPSGDILELGSKNLKDNTGYDLKHLFIGSEGTLGVITKVLLNCPPLPQNRQAAFLACHTYDHVQSLLQLAKTTLGEVLAAFEYMDRPILELVARNRNRNRNQPLPLTMEDGTTPYPFCVLVETQGAREDHDAAKLEAFLEQGMEEGVIADGVLAQDLTRLLDMWEVRESCGLAVAGTGRIYKYDVSLPINKFQEVIDEMRAHLAETHPNALSVNWGHVIDGNLHFNVVTPGDFQDDPSLTARIEPRIFEIVIRHHGSISAEHGLGVCKNNYLPMIKSAAVLNVMKSTKAMFDPNGIMNPGKFLPSR